jgi:hypothetical protein
MLDCFTLEHAEDCILGSSQSAIDPSPRADGRLDMYGKFRGLLNGDGIRVEAICHWSARSRKSGQLGQEDAILREVRECGCRDLAEPQQ